MARIYPSTAAVALTASAAAAGFTAATAAASAGVLPLGPLVSTTRPLAPAARTEDKPQSQGFAAAAIATAAAAASPPATLTAAVIATAATALAPPPESLEASAVATAATAAALAPAAVAAATAAAAAAAATGASSVDKDERAGRRLKSEAFHREKAIEWFHVGMQHLALHPPPEDTVSQNIAGFVHRHLQAAPTSPPLCRCLPVNLPPIASSRGLSSSRRRLVVAVDLDETLVHSCLKPLGRRPAFNLLLTDGTTGAGSRTANVYVRPYALDMLEAAASMAEVVLFTASTSAYADRVRG
ncbi:hypothetical protein ACSSS7_006434 [Eimeria intestinalis]